MIPLPPNSQLFADAESTARAAADELLAIVASAPNERVAICLSGGSTPKRLYELLAGPNYATRLPWQRLHWFFGDDRLVPHADRESNVWLVREAFGVDGPAAQANLYPIPTTGTAEEGARAYEARLREFYCADTLDPRRPLFDLVLLGLGSDGHTASLFPGKPAVDEHKAWAVAVPEAGMEPFVPRITLTFPVLASTRAALFLVNGAGKRDPLSRLSRGVDLPAGRIASQGTLTWFVDRQAADA